MGALLQRNCNQEDIVEEVEEETPEEELKYSAERGKLPMGTGPYASLGRRKNEAIMPEKEEENEESEKEETPNDVDEEEELDSTSIVFAEEDDIGVLTVDDPSLIIPSKDQAKPLRFTGQFLPVSFSPVGSEVDLRAPKKKATIEMPKVNVGKEKRTKAVVDNDEESWLMDGRINKQMGSPR